MILDIDPKVDYAFKHLFGREATRSILIDVIDSILEPAPGHHIQDIELLNPFNPKEAFDDKLSILDIKARDQSGRQFNVEMQMVGFRSYKKRILYYCAKLHQQQLQTGQDYSELKPTISISFLNHILFPHTPNYHLRFRLLDDTGRLLLSDDMEFHVLELPKFIKTSTELVSSLDVWLYFLRHAEKIDTEALPPALNLPVVFRAFKELQMLTQNDLERERYESRRKAQLDYNTGLKEARLEGHLEGHLEGRLEGEKIGVIHLCQRLLKRPQTPTEQLAGQSLEDLTRLAEDLQEQLLKQ